MCIGEISNELWNSALIAKALQDEEWISTIVNHYP